MIAINNDALNRRFLSACELLSVLDNNLLNILRTVNAFTFHKESEMAPFHEGFCMARNLHKASTEALKAAAWRLLDRDSVETFFRLTDLSCKEAILALNCAMELHPDDRFPPLRDLLKSARTIANAQSQPQ